MNDDNPAQDRPEPRVAPAPARHARKRRRRWVFHFSFWPTLGLLALALFMVLASMAATGRQVPLPDWIADKVETRLNREIPTGSLTLWRVEFGVSPEGLPRLSLVELGLRDETGLEIARIYRVQTSFDLRAALRGRLEPSRLFLTGAEVTLRRRADGTFDLTFGQGAMASGASGDLASVLDAIDAVFATAPMSQVRSINANALTITLEDARSGRLWQVTDGRLKLTQSDQIIDITVNFDVFNQTEELAEVVLGFRTDKTSPAASISANFRNAAAADIAAQSPLLAFLGVLDAPISGALRSAISDSGEISELVGTLELGAGALSPIAGARPVRFETAKVYIDYAPEEQRLDFTSINMRSELGEVLGHGALYLSNYRNGWPATLLGQFQIESAAIRAGDLFENTVEIEGGAADFRLHLNPFTLELGQVVLVQEGTSFNVSGEVSASSGGWSLALDGAVAQIGQPQALALWPLLLAPKARAWVAENVTGGTLTGLDASLRMAPGMARRVSVEAGFHDFSARVVKAMAPLEQGAGYMVINDDRFMAVAEGGHIRAPDGGEVEIAGTAFTVPDMTTKPTPATVDVQFAGPLKALLTILDAKPYNVFKNTDFGPDIATGQVTGSGRVALVMQPKLRPEDVEFSFDAQVAQVRSDKLVPGKVVTAPRARVEVDNRHIEVSGTARIGAASGTGSWFAAIGPGADGSSRLEATVDLNQEALDEFNITLPAGSVAGQGSGQLVLEFSRGQQPSYRLTSDLNRLALAIPEIGWSKPRNRTGNLLIAGHLGQPVTVERLQFSAPGLKAEGLITLKPDGNFDEAVFERVRLLNWLDAPVTISGRGPGRPVAISVLGGSADMSRATFGDSSTGAGPDSDAEAPIDIRLDRLKVAEGIELTGFNATLDRAGGLHGTFAARVNGGPRITGVVAPQTAGTAFRIRSDDAGGVLKAAGVFESMRGGEMDLILAPHPGEGVYDGQLDITQIRTTSAPALLELLGAISVVGLLEQVQEEGILFQTVEARFRMTPSEVIISKGSAIGASMGISMDGTYKLGVSEMDLAGVLSPFYILNGLGQIFTRRGEGLIGFTYTLKGTPDEPIVSVNPLSIFTPAMFRELFRRPPPKLPD